MRKWHDRYGFLIAISAGALFFVPATSNAKHSRAIRSDSHRAGPPIKALSPVIERSRYSHDGSVLQANGPQRIFFWFDNTGSMLARVGGSTRIAIARAAAERWARSLPVPSAITVEVLTIAPRVACIGTFALRSEADRTALIDAINGIKAVLNSQTAFSRIDVDVAEIARRDTAANEELLAWGITDAVSDEPQADLRAGDMGDQTVALGGVYAVVAGELPGFDALTDRGSGRRSSSIGRSRSGHSSALRALRAGGIHLEAASAVEGTITPGFFGGPGSLRTQLRIINNVGIARMVDFDSATPSGLSIRFDPNSVEVAAGQSTTVTVELSATGPVRGAATLVARLPDGRSQSHSFSLRLAPSSWILAYGWVLALSVAMAAVSFFLLARRMRTPVLVGDHANEDRQAALGIGDEVPLSTFHPSAAGTLRRGWLGFAIVADGVPMSTSGRIIKPGHQIRYRLGEAVRSGDGAFAVYRIHSPTIADIAPLDPPTGGLR